jgi:hypothetical protein
MIDSFTVQSSVQYVMISDSSLNSVHVLHVTNRCQTSQSLSVLSLRWLYLRTTDILLSLLTVVDCGLDQQISGNSIVNLIPNSQVDQSNWFGESFHSNLFSFIQVCYKTCTVETINKH